LWLLVGPSSQDSLVDPAQEAVTPAIQALCSELGDSPAEDLGPLLQRGFEVYVAEMRAFRARSAMQIAEALHDRARATWSAISLASAKRRAGADGGGVRVLQDQIEHTEPGPDWVALYEALALACDGAGLRELQLDALGHAYAKGGTDAQQILGGLALREGRWQEAGRLFGGLVDRALVGSREPEPWALPGWGLSLLETMP